MDPDVSNELQADMEVQSDLKVMETDPASLRDFWHIRRKHPRHEGQYQALGVLNGALVWGETMLRFYSAADASAFLELFPAQSHGAEIV